MSLPRIGVTLGDPGGIGPEIVLKALLRWPELPPAHYVLYGLSELMEREERSLGVRLGWTAFNPEEEFEQTHFSLKPVPVPFAAAVKGKPSAEGGRASFEFFRQASADAAAGMIKALVTAPISKLAWDLAGVAFRGHTQYLEQFYPDAIMTFWSEKLIVALLSHHLPLKAALEKIDKDGLVRFVNILRAGVEKARPGTYRFLMAGLNPHAGEDGLLGAEEKDVIGPAVEAARAAGADISGPHAPDVVFRLAYGRPRRIVIALYHDQGLIPFKMEAFDTGVNVTLGLPFIRSSPDHGTAFDIAGKNLANPQSMFEAIRLAADLSLGVF
jgi:4-hydroxythreonine-4-phosphate dehydrogenase